MSRSAKVYPIPDRGANPPSITLVVPVYNEETSLADFLNAITPVLDAIRPRARFEILFVNDGSQDGTERIVRRSRKCATDCGISLRATEPAIRTIPRRMRRVSW